MEKSRKEKYIGRRMPRRDALVKAQGRAKYTADYRTADMLWGKAVFSGMAHARILRVDAAKAEALPGVVCVMTAKDLPAAKKYGIFCADKPVIAENMILYEGDPIAFIAAETKEIAEEAAALIEAEYEALPVVEDPREALRDDVPPIHENHPVTGNAKVMAEVTLDRGDVDAAFAEADIILEDDFETPQIEHVYLEPDCCIARWVDDTDVLEIVAPQQAVYSTLRALAPVFGLPESRVRFISPYVGGGFGGKEDSCCDLAVIAGLLAMKTRRKVYSEFTAEEVFRYTGKRHGSYVHHRMAATKDGRVIGLDIDIILDKGAYQSMSGLTGGPHAVAQRTVLYAAGPYSVENVRIRSRAVFTNHPYGAAMRGFGAPQIHFAGESQMNELAHRLNMDPVAIRKLNMITPERPTSFGQVLTEENGLGLEECMDKVKAELDKPFMPKHPVRPSQRRGMGLAAYIYGTGMPYKSEGAMCVVHVNRDASVEVGISTTEMGQGAQTVMAQIAAEALGVPVETVNVPLPDTFLSPDSGPTVASRSTTFVGNAILDACRKLLAGFTEAVAHGVGCSPEEVTYAKGVFAAPDGQEIPLRRAIYMAATQAIPQSAVGIWYPPVDIGFGPKGGNSMHTYSFGCQGIDLLLDVETGEIELLRSVLACDIGHALNPQLVEGQMEGGAVMGLGYALTEGVEYKKGVVSNDSMKDYVILGFKDLPQMTSIIVEAANCMGPFGAKGVGEPPLVATAPAVREAIRNASDGVKLNRIPFTPERVITGIYKAKEGGQTS
ncbi:MAG: xanthine dehydrogenase family protein [Lachnospiraceae bacterium]|nr:xanthine dehydrogenase family protein [Lachnospiraceae bacterium]